MKKEIISNVVVSVVTAAVLGVGAWFLGVFEAGTDAQDKELIRAVLEKELTTDAGKTYKARLAEVGSQLTVLETRADALRSDVEDLEDIALDLAGGN
jgi:hypothetical protein